MKQSDSIDKLAQALCEAQTMMGGAVKDSENPFFKSKYADLTSVVKAIKEPFAKHGLSYVQFPYSTESGVGVTTRLMHGSGQWLESEFVLPIVKQDPQAAGSAITYARRYALQSIAGIPTADDDAEATALRSGPPFTDIQKQEFDELLASGSATAYVVFTQTVGEDVMNALCATFEKGKISQGKATMRKLDGIGWGIFRASAEAIKVHCVNSDSEGLLECISELEPLERKIVGGMLEPHEIKAIKDVQQLGESN